MSSYPRFLAGLDLPRNRDLSPLPRACFLDQSPPPHPCASRSSFASPGRWPYFKGFGMPALQSTSTVPTPRCVFSHVLQSDPWSWCCMRSGSTTHSGSTGDSEEFLPPVQPTADTMATSISTRCHRTTIPSLISTSTTPGGLRQNGRTAQTNQVTIAEAASDRAGTAPTHNEGYPRAGLYGLTVP